eukprot:11636196-Heterocapsa_arctica.AAC.1
MVAELGLSYVDIDGCAVCAQDNNGNAIFKPWRFAVSSPYLAQILLHRRCSCDYEHVPCAAARAQNPPSTWTRSAGPCTRACTCTRLPARRRQR